MSDGESLVSLEIQNVSLVFPGRNSEDAIHVLDHVNLNVEGREIVVVLGPSGCGKTSLLNLLAGFIRPTEGRILLDSKEVVGPHKDRGVVFQKHALLPWLNVIDNAEFGLMLQRVPKQTRREISLRFLNLVGLKEFQNHPIYQLSGGMQQRLGIARVLSSDPQIMLMDEPFGALDALTRDGMQELLLKVWADTRKMIFFITHSVEEALFLATRLVVMSSRPGRIVHSFELDFSRRYLDQKDSRAIKSHPDYIAMREQIFAIIRQQGLAKSPRSSNETI